MSVAAFAKRLRSKHHSDRSNAVVALGKLRDPAAIPVLERVLRGEIPDLEGRTIEALARIGPASVPVLCQEFLRRSKMVGSKAGPNLIERITNIPLFSADLSFRLEIAQALLTLLDGPQPTALRALLPDLEKLCASGRVHRDHKVVFRALAERIQTLTDASDTLPLPAEAPGAELASLPLPASSELKARGLPLPSEED